MAVFAILHVTYKCDIFQDGRLHKFCTCPEVNIVYRTVDGYFITIMLLNKNLGSIMQDLLLIMLISGKKSNDQSSLDYVPSVRMGYTKGNQINPEQRKARHLRAEKRESERQHHEVATALLDVSSQESITPPDLDSNLPGVF